MLSKAKGQVLRLSALMHLLFSLTNDDEKDDIQLVICDEAVKAAINFVNVCIQQAAFIAGRGDIEEETCQITAWGVCFHILCYFMPNRHLLLFRAHRIITNVIQ